MVVRTAIVRYFLKRPLLLIFFYLSNRNVYNKTDVAAPFGGFKQSGFGKDLGKEALNEYLKTKCVTIEY